MNDTQGARKAAHLLSEALGRLESAECLITSAKEHYPDKDAGDYVYNQVLHNTAALIGYVQLLRVPALTYAGETDALQREADSCRP